MGTISDCWHLKKWTSVKKFFYVLTLLPKDVENTENFSDWRFFHLPLVSMTPMVHLELQISLWILAKKILNGSNSVLRGLGETDSCKKTWSQKTRGTVPWRKSIFTIFASYPQSYLSSKIDSHNIIYSERQLLLPSFMIIFVSYLKKQKIMRGAAITPKLLAGNSNSAFFRISCLFLESREFPFRSCLELQLVISSICSMDF